MVEALAGLLLVVGEIENEAGMHVLEDAVPFRTRQLVDGVDGALGVVGTQCAPARQQRGRQVGDRAAGGEAELLARLLEIPGLERLHAEHEMRIAVVAVELDHPIREPRRFVDVAVGEHGVEGEFEQLRIALIGAQSRPVIDRGGIGIALQIGLARREVIAGWRDTGRVARSWRLRRQGLGEGPADGGCDHGDGTERRYFHGDLLSKKWARSISAMPNTAIPKTMDPHGSGSGHQAICGEWPPDFQE